MTTFAHVQTRMCMFHGYRRHGTMQSNYSSVKIQLIAPELQSLIWPHRPFDGTEPRTGVPCLVGLFDSVSFKLQISTNKKNHRWWGKHIPRLVLLAIRTTGPTKTYHKLYSIHKSTYRRLLILKVQYWVKDDTLRCRIVRRFYHDGWNTGRTLCRPRSFWVAWRRHFSALFRTALPDWQMGKKRKSSAIQKRIKCDALAAVSEQRLHVRDWGIRSA